MTKSQSHPLDDSANKTEPEPDQPKASFIVPATGRTISVGVGLKEGEVAMLDSIVAEYDITRNALMRYAIRHFLARYAGGEIDLGSDVEAPEPKKRLMMP